MHKQVSLPTGKTCQPAPRPRAGEPISPPCPLRQTSVEAGEKRVQGRFGILTMVLDPPPDNGIAPCSQVLKGSVRCGTRRAGTQHGSYTSPRETHGTSRHRSSGIAVRTGTIVATVIPYPFNATTTIRYDLPTDARVRLSVFKATGQKVEILLNEHQTAGAHETVFSGNRYPTGVYIIRIAVDQFTAARKIVLSK